MDKVNGFCYKEPGIVIPAHFPSCFLYHISYLLGEDAPYLPEFPNDKASIILPKEADP